MDKIYFEMNDKERQLNLIANNLDYAVCVISEGLGVTGEFNLSISEVNDLQERISDNLLKAWQDISFLQSHLVKEE